MDSKLTPMMKQYMEIKRKHQTEILFFRMGDFYEMFFEDAQTASKILDIALTSRQNDVPMCGLPYHAADNYIARLIKAGKRVAICEQLESVPSSGTIVKRDVVRIMTPGTVIESNLLQSDDNNFLASIIIGDSDIGLAFVDISTGDFFLSSIEKSLELFRGEITKFSPTEVVLKEGSDPNDDIFTEYIKNRNIPIYRINEWLYDSDYMKGLICEIFNIVSIKGLGIDSPVDIISAGSILQYLQETQKRSFDHLKHPRKMVSTDRMILDDATISNLELVENQQDRSRNRTLFSVLNCTKTPMGRRTLERNILQPLLSIEELEHRHDIIQYLYEYHDLTSALQTRLKDIHDIERLISRFSIGKIFPRNFIALKHSLEASLEIKGTLKEQPGDNFKLLAKKISDMKQLVKRIDAAVSDEPALTPEQGRIIQPGYNPELDRLYELKTDAKTWILNYQEEEKKRLGATSLKIKYNKILSYYIEISKAQAVNIPEDYYRKQTLVSSERFTTEKLQKFEGDILSASDKIVVLEKKEIEKLVKDILLRQKELQELAVVIAEIDMYASLAVAAIENRFTRPSFSTVNNTHILDGRHPVVEKYYTKEIFIPNDINLDDKENIIKIITGPNMSGKSTYIRMAAIIQLMAQIGSFVPAEKAELSIVDRIFTRIGASDNISRGESTFLVEMNETANILNNASDRSLIIMDEVGRGTSTYDGLSIAWAVVEYILRYIKAKTLFATHYHELTQLGSKTGIVNYNVLVKEHMSGVDFLHKMVKGAADKSYGIHVAKLAGIPKQIIGRAAKILDKHERSSKSGKNSIPNLEEQSSEQLEIFNAANHLVIQAIRNIDLDEVTPINALNELSRLKKLID
ncbi:MAG: DNA mismatch repair protein MutS [bacterium]|nr:DNA mismatch repair protein MutS [bacterium]